MQRGKGLLNPVSIGEVGRPPNSRWFPKHERGFATAVVDSGSRVGNVLALPIATGPIALVSWHFSFIVLGLLGVVWAVIWYAVYRDPTKHPRANEQERQYLLENGARIDETDDSEAAKIKWRTLFRYRTIRGMMLGFFCLNFVIYFFLTWFPTYLKDARGFDLAQLGTLGMIPGLCAVLLGWVAGRVTDKAIQHGADVTRVRKIVMVGGLLGGSVIFFAAMAPSFALAGVVALVGAATYAFVVGRAEPLPILPPRGSK